MEIMKGYKQTEIGIIPNDWDVTEIPNLAKNKTAGIKIGPFGSALKKELLVKKGFKVYGQENVFEKNVNIGDRYVTKEHFKKLKSCELSPGDFIVSMMGTIGQCMILPKYMEKGIMDSHLLKIKLDSKLVNSHYFEFVFSSFLTNNQIKMLSVGGIMDGLSSTIVKKLLIPLPPTLQEQTAIANALSDTDGWINSLEQLLTKKRQIKQGAMQELLQPKEGWDKKKLGEIITLQGGYAFKSELFKNSGIPIIRISDVENNKVNTTYSVCYEPFNITKEFVAKKGDVLIAMSGATTGKIGVYTDEKIAYINQRVGKFVVLNEKETSNSFISHVVRSERFKEQLTKEIAQGAQPNISGKQIESIIFQIPNNIKEQTHIATILSDMDEEIAQLETKLAKAKQIKQGMMQVLLTGRIRLV